MPNKYYERGRRAEYEAQEMLQKEGYEVYRTAGSHGRADLICIAPLVGDLGLLDRHLARLIQVKTCQEKDIKKYEKEKVPGIELWIKVMGHGWHQL